MNDELPNEVEAYEQDCRNEEQRERAYYELYKAFNEVYGEIMEFHDFCQWMDATVNMLKVSNGINYQVL